MRPTHRTQPYRRKRGRPKSPVLTAMKRGRPRYLANPMDVRRRLQRRRLSQVLRK